MSEVDYTDVRARASISVVELFGLFEQKPESFVLVDVRDGDVPFTIPGAIRIPEEGVLGWVADAPKEKLIVVYTSDGDCHAAIRTVVRLLTLGLDARELNGGIAAWTMLKLPVDPEG